MKKIVSNSIIYLAASVVTQLINLLLVPIYTRKLSVDDVGLYNLLTTIQSLLLILITVSIYSGMVRFYNETEYKNTLKNTTIVFITIWGSFVLIASNMIYPFIGNAFFSEIPSMGKYINIILWITLIETIITTYGSYYAMGLRAILSSSTQVFNMLLRFVITLYFVVMADYGLIGLLYGQLLGSIITLLLIFIYDAKNLKLEFNKDLFFKMLKYSAGLAPGQLSSWVLTLIDRFFIKEMVSLGAVGIYSIAYKIGMIINPIFLVPFAKIFTPIKFKVYSEVDGKEKLRSIFRYYNLIGWFFILVLALFADLGIYILATSEYAEGYLLVPLIAISYFIWGLGEFYALGFHIANKMGINSLVVTIAAILNIILNIMLIPKFGMYGAAYSTIIAYIVANVFYYFIGKKYYDLEVNLFAPYKPGTIAGLIYIGYYFMKPLFSNLFYMIPLNVFLLFVYLILCVVFNLLKKEELSSVKIFVQTKLMKTRSS